MTIEQAKVSELALIFGPYAYQEDVSGVTAFQYTDESETTRRGANNFGNTGPLNITDSYQGVNGSFTLEGADGEDQLQAIISGTPLASFVLDNPKRRYPFYIVSNAYEEDGSTPVRGHFIDYAKLAGTPAQVGPDARTYNFQAKASKRARAKKVVIKVFDGNAVPVTALSLAEEAYADGDGNMALLVLRQTTGTKTVTRLVKTTDYTEATVANVTTVTLVSGLAATEKALVVYIQE
ncbi:MAG: hypothetical protein ACYCX4_02675 [Bacillota bacterium]